MADSLDEMVNRLYRVKLLLADYQARKPDSRETQFLAACADMIERRGGVTARMDGWLEQLLAQGAPRQPTQEDLDLAERAESSAPIAGVQGEFLLEMAQKLKVGDKITDRQRAAVSTLVEKLSAETAALTADELRAVDMARRIELGYSTYYLQERPTAYSRARAVINAREEGRDVTRADFDALLSVFGRLRDVAYPKIKKGDLVFQRGTEDAVLVVSLPYVPDYSRRDPVVHVDVLTPAGEKTAVPISGLLKRRKSAKV
jgi:hypothetical protein